jgi:hypothetical protein
MLENLKASLNSVLIKKNERRDAEREKEEQERQEKPEEKEDSMIQCDTVGIIHVYNNPNSTNLLMQNMAADSRSSFSVNHACFAFGEEMQRGKKKNRRGRKSLKKKKIP